MTPSSVLVGRFLTAEIGEFCMSCGLTGPLSYGSPVLLCFLVKVNQASGISFPPSLLMLLGCRSMTNSKPPALHEVEKLNDAGHRFYSSTAFLVVGLPDRLLPASNL